MTKQQTEAYEKLDYSTALRRAEQNNSTVERETAIDDAINRDADQQVPELRESMAEIAKAEKQIADAKARQRVALEIQSDFDQRVETHRTIGAELESLIGLHATIKELIQTQTTNVNGVLAQARHGVDPNLIIGMVNRLHSIQFADEYIAKRLPVLRKEYKASEAAIKALADKHGVKI